MAKIMRKKRGENTIKLTVHFFTNNLPKGADDKTAWPSGVIQMKYNGSRNLPAPGAPNQLIFNSAEELLPKMDELLTKNGVKLIKIPDNNYTTVSLSKVNPRETTTSKTA